MSETLKRLSFPVGDLQCNCSLVYDELTKEAIVVDPGDEFDVINQHIRHLGLKLKYAIQTHAHFDHIGATRELKENHASMKIALHKADEQIYQMLPMQGQMFGFQFDEPKPIDHFLQDNEELKIGSHSFQVLHTPGHSPGGVCVHFKEGVLTNTPFLFSGDSLFLGSIGRTDLWGADFKTLSKSIKDRIYTLDDETLVLPGHGPETKVGFEAKRNPFVTR